LIATAMGLFAAIPAVIAYNRFADQVEPPGTALRHLHGRVLDHFAALRAGPRRSGLKPWPTRARRRKLMGEINVVPYIDVMLVLLIIFMITAPLLKEGVKVDLPTAAAKPLDPAFLNKHEPLVVTIDSRGRLYVNIGRNPDQPVSEATVSSAHDRAAAHRDPQTPILVKADTTVPYGSVVHAMVLLQKAGAAKLGFLTDPRRIKNPAPRDAGRRPPERSDADVLREYSPSVLFSLLLHGLFIAALVFSAQIQFTHSPRICSPADERDGRRFGSFACGRARAGGGCRQSRRAGPGRCTGAGAAAQERRRRRPSPSMPRGSKRPPRPSKPKTPSARRPPRRRPMPARAPSGQSGRCAACARGEAAAEAKQAAEEKQAAARQAGGRRQARRRGQKGRRRARQGGSRGGIAPANGRMRNMSSEVESGPLGDRYRLSLQNRITHAWIKPPSARRGIDCRVEVTQIPGGEVTNARVTQCNGDAAVRQSIENAVYRASPIAGSAGSGPVPQSLRIRVQAQ
jgi:biopolymer transport protein TolR